MHVVVQLADYMLRLKLDKGRKFLQSLITMYTMYLMLRGKRGLTDYLDSLLLFISDVISWSQPDATPAKKKMWHMFSTNLSCFNEEAGEIAFSVLARLIMGSSRKNQHPICQTQFQMLKTNMHTANALGYDIGFAFGKGKHVGHLEVGEEDIEVTKRFLLRYIKECKVNIYRPYAKDFQKMKDRQSCFQGREGKWKVETMPRLYKSVRKVLPKHIIQAKKRMVSWWIAKNTKHWPGSNNANIYGDADPSSSDDGSSGGDGDGFNPAPDDGDDDRSDGDDGGRGGDQEDVQDQASGDDGNDPDAKAAGHELEPMNEIKGKDPMPRAKPKKKKQRQQKPQAVKRKRRRKASKVADPDSGDDSYSPVQPRRAGDCRRSGRKRNTQNHIECEDEYEGFASSADEIFMGEM